MDHRRWRPPRHLLVESLSRYSRGRYPYQAPAFSVLHYAGDRLFDYELDLMNIAEVGELLVESAWVPAAGMSVPGPHPDRNITPPRLESP